MYFNQHNISSLLKSASAHRYTATVTLLVILVSISRNVRGETLCGTSDAFCLSGNCTSDSNTTSCTCPDHFTSCQIQAGTTCDQISDYCMNGATCIASADNSTIECQCPQGFNGTRCQFNSCDITADCSGNALSCQNDAASGTKTCQCDTCHTGDTCSEDVDLCSNTNCQHGTCKTLCQDSRIETDCDCDAGWRGNRCDFDIDECGSPSPCQHGASCLNTQGSYTCQCTEGWNGTNCETNINECESSLLFCDPDNTMNCTDSQGSYACVCHQGYVGRNCETPSCDNIACSGNGLCNITDTNRWQCNCDKFIEGTLCEDIGPCTSDPCVHGSCSQQYNSTSRLFSYSCTCDQGYKGYNCSEDIDECLELSPCANGGSCTNTDGNYTCTCSQYWTGYNCQVDVLECDTPGICGAGGCKELAGGYQCDCSDTGYEGMNCADNINECEISQPCMNSANCTDTPGSYLCVCLSEWTGVHCEIRNFCKDQCVIENTVDKKCTNLADRAFCNCTDQWLGEDCSVMNNCTASCYNGGKCVDSGGVAVCLCAAKYTGADCGTPLNNGEDGVNILAIVIPIVVAVVLAIVIGLIVCFVLARQKRANRGRYSPSRNENSGINVEMSNALKPPPEERLI